MIVFHQPKEEVMFTSDDIMWAPEIAQFAGVKVETIRGSRWKKKSRFPLRKQGKKLFAFRIEAQKWLQDAACNGQMLNG